MSATEPLTATRCPVCGQKLVGKLGTNQFFCWTCFVEFHRFRDSFRVFAIDQEGGLKAVEGSWDTEKTDTKG